MEKLGEYLSVKIYFLYQFYIYSRCNPTHTTYYFKPHSMKFYYSKLILFCSLLLLMMISCSKKNIEKTDVRIENLQWTRVTEGFTVNMISVGIEH